MLRTTLTGTHALLGCEIERDVAGLLDPDGFGAMRELVDGRWPDFSRPPRELLDDAQGGVQQQDGGKERWDTKPPGASAEARDSKGGGQSWQRELCDVKRGEKAGDGLPDLSIAHRRCKRIRLVSDSPVD